MAVILHGPMLVVTASLTLVGAIGLDRRVLGVVRVALDNRAVSHGACTTSQVIKSGGLKMDQERFHGEWLLRQMRSSHVTAD